MHPAAWTCESFTLKHPSSAGRSDRQWVCVAAAEAQRATVCESGPAGRARGRGETKVSVPPWPTSVLGPILLHGAQSSLTVDEIEIRSVALLGFSIFIALRSTVPVRHLQTLLGMQRDVAFVEACQSLSQTHKISQLNTLTHTQTHSCTYDGPQDKERDREFSILKQDITSECLRGEIQKNLNRSVSLFSFSYFTPFRCFSF